MVKSKQYDKNHGRSQLGIWGLLTGSILFHGALLLLPMPQRWLTSTDSAPKPKKVLEESGAIALTALPLVASPEPEAINPVEPVVPPEVIEAAPPPPLTQVPDSLPKEIEEPVDNEILDPPIEPPLEEPPPEEPPSEAPNGEPEAGLAFEFRDDFPHVGDAKAGCSNYGLGNCRTVDAQNLREVARVLKQELKVQGYRLEDVTPEDSEEHANHKIFEMSLSDSDEVKYLNIFGVDDQLTGAFYIITPTLITRQDLKELENNT